MIRFHAEIGASAATAKRTPFWLQANQYGIVPDTSPFATIRVGVHANRLYHHYTPTTDATRRKSKFAGWGYGLELIANAGVRKAFLMPEAYAKAQIWRFELAAGRRREWVGLADSTVGSGSYIWSGNALPLPKIQLSLPAYTSIGFTRGVLAFRGFYAHGWFSNQGPVTHSYLHQKALYGRLGKPSWPIKLYGGFNHQVQWGGRSDVIKDKTAIRNGRFPAHFRDYISAVTGVSLGYNPRVDTTQYSYVDRWNRIGNHLGTIDVGMEITGRHYSLLLYRQSIYEDGSLFYLTNIIDGLNGVRFRNSRRSSAEWHFDDFVVELLYTKSQGGAVFGSTDKERGADNYFNHTQYIDGWSYLGRTIGTPFITPARDTRPDLPRYETDSLLAFCNNNRVRVIHLGVAGRFRQCYTFRLKGSISDNAGTYIRPFPTRVRQFSALLTVGFPLRIWRDVQATASLAVDQGRLYTNSTGVYVSVRKTWNRLPKSALSDE